ncbi:Putative Calcium-translocating P-type ATPase, PMCA-type [Rhizopus microsporus]|nr:Putative Calcium-translocating P-type ATPase, PMCA-type [Rhizopus microsporus]
MLVLSYMNHHWISMNELLTTLISIVIQAITVIVVAVPEGLPMAVTLALAFATTEMLKDNNLVRHLSACETMGNATAVCSDKTGTLTENKMTVVSASVAEKQFTRTHDMQRWRYQVNPLALDLTIEAISVNSTAFEGKDGEGQIKFIGSTTECAMIEFARKLGYSYQDHRAASRSALIYPFSSTVKSMTTVIEVNDCNARSPNRSQYRVYTKGAAETIIKACTHYMDIKGQVRPIESHIRVEQEMLVNAYAERSLRTLAIAYRDVDQATFLSFSPDDAPIHNLVLLGIVGIQDQLRPGVIESVQAFRRAGVFVRMITGDNLETAKAIAKECGILTPGGIAMTGPEFRALNSRQQYEVIPRLQVLARSSPIDKTIVVSRLQERNEVVAMTGDGTNDGPALKLANVGFAMGIAGTEVAKEASDIILMDDNFNSILQALKWGRAVNDGVRKFLTFQLTVNIAAVVLSFISAVVSEKSESILSAVQLLWVNMIMDTFAALALATEPLTDDLVKRKPLRKDSSLINWRMSRMIFGQAFFQIAVNLILMFHGPALFGLDPSNTKVLRTMVFNVFVFLQVFNELNCRRIDDRLNILRGITHDHLFLIIQGFVVISQVIIVQYGGLAFKTAPLSLSQWLITIGIGSLSIPAGTFIRLLPNRLPCFWSENNDDEFNHEISYSRLYWESAVQHVMKDVQNKKAVHEYKF